jgi:hypothetical protein
MRKKNTLVLLLLYEKTETSSVCLIQFLGEKNPTISKPNLFLVWSGLYVFGQSTNTLP